ncbi:MAG: HyaD/HybD family hydrogenase maturation endopeptidase [Gammaproteobacteria bacterium]|nr:HyaD/HybD family hydrogenase maturation endopeptidase [Gammaproteobacteria bacterium]MCP5458071.1 HyaD/HybD family hydrogenase maturation endopeptidase [Gammaproteobacteria bacterium]
MPTTLVLGVGNTLLSDEGIGIHVIRYLERHHPDLPGVAYLDGGTLSFTLAELIGEADQLIVVDAARIDAQPGAIRLFLDAAVDHFLGTGKHSVHEVGLSDLMDISRLTDSLPAKRALIGIQPQQLDWGERPSPSVAAAIPDAAKLVLELIHDWRQPAPQAY